MLLGTVTLSEPFSSPPPGIVPPGKVANGWSAADGFPSLIVSTVRSPGWATRRENENFRCTLSPEGCASATAYVAENCGPAARSAPGARANPATISSAGTDHDRTRQPSRCRAIVRPPVAWVQAG